VLAYEGFFLFLLPTRNRRALELKGQKEGGAGFGSRISLASLSHLSRISLASLSHLSRIFCFLNLGVLEDHLLLSGFTHVRTYGYILSLLWPVYFSIATPSFLPHSISQKKKSFSSPEGTAKASPKTKHRHYKK